MGDGMVSFVYFCTADAVQNDPKEVSYLCSAVFSLANDPPVQAQGLRIVFNVNRRCRIVNRQGLAYQRSGQIYEPTTAGVLRGAGEKLSDSQPVGMDIAQ